MARAFRLSRMMIVTQKHSTNRLMLKFFKNKNYLQKCLVFTDTTKAILIHTNKTNTVHVEERKHIDILTSHFKNEQNNC